MRSRDGVPRRPPEMNRARIGPLSLPALAFALIGSVVLIWPMLVLGGPLLYADSVEYLNWGRKLFLVLGRILDAQNSGGGSRGAIAGAASRVESIRSVPYSATLYAFALTPLRLILPAAAQTALVLVMVWPLLQGVRAAPRTAVAGAAAALALLTPLPWFAAYVMPDILGAAVILYAALLVRRLDAVDWPGRILLATVAAFAIVSHLGNIPVAAASLGAALAIRTIERRLTLAACLLGAAPLVLAMTANVLVGVIAFGEPSVAPKRLPLVLARSIADGPARWYLEKHCATEGYAICEIFGDEIPRSVNKIVFASTGLQGATPEQVARVRAEETTILWRAFKAYPLAQSWSLTRNVVKQFFSIGTGQFAFADIVTGPDGDLSVRLDRKRGRGMLEAVGTVHLVTCVGALAWLLFALGRGGPGRGRDNQEIFVVILAGLAANAAIFGGLSAPVDRYQARVAWLLPLLAAVVWLEGLPRPGPRARAARTDRIEPP